MFLTFGIFDILHLTFVKFDISYLTFLTFMKIDFVRSAENKIIVFLTFWKFWTFLTFHFGAEEPDSGGPRNPGGDSPGNPAQPPRNPGREQAGTAHRLLWNTV